MKDYIEREKVLKDLLDQCKITGYGGLTANDVKYVFSLQTNADVRPVVRGKWTLNKDGSGTCSECGFVQKSCWDLDNWDNFCYHCGADMRGDDK